MYSLLTFWSALDPNQRGLLWFNPTAGNDQAAARSPLLFSPGGMGTRKGQKVKLLG